MPEEIAGTPGWVDQRLDEVFADMPQDPAVDAARNRYATCLAGEKSPSTPTDLLGTEFDRCRRTLRMALADAGVNAVLRAAIDTRLELLEAEIAEES